MRQASWKHITVISKVNGIAAIGNKPASAHKNIGGQQNMVGFF